LGAFDLFWVEVVGFGHVEVGNEVVGGLGGEHVLVNGDVVEELLVAALLKVVHDRHFGWIVLYH